MSILDQMYDVYIIKNSGVPLVSGCTATDYCMSHMGQHQLQSGFLAAINSFVHEAFEEEILQTIELGQLQINIKAKGELIFAAIHSIDSDRSIIKEKISLALDKFIHKYHLELQKDLLNLSIFDGAQEILEEVGLVEGKLVSTEMAQKAENSKKSKLLRWIKGILSR